MRINVKGTVIGLVIGILAVGTTAALASVPTKTVHTFCVGVQGGGGVSRYDLNLHGKLERVCIVGRRGARGAQGVQGVQGEQGATGETGAQGEQGAAGQDGTNGTNGVDGKDGTNGTDGTNGADGSSVTAQVVEGGIAIYQDGTFIGLLTNGANGQDGAPGAVGPAGPAGPAGPQGAPGADGTVTGVVAVCASPGGNLKLCGGDNGHDPVGYLALEGSTTP